VRTASPISARWRRSQPVDGLATVGLAWPALVSAIAGVDAVPSDHDGGTSSMTTFGVHGAPINQPLLTAPMDPVARTLSVHFGTA
jgi:hypothetical protein